MITIDEVSIMLGCFCVLISLFSFFHPENIKGSGFRTLTFMSTIGWFTSVVYQILYLLDA